MNEKAKLTDNIEPDEEAPDGLGGDLNRSSHLSSFEPRNNHMDSQVLQGMEQIYDRWEAYVETVQF